MVQGTARCPNYYLRSILQRCILWPYGPAAVEQRHEELLRRSQSFDYSTYLNGEFAGGYQHQRLDLR